MRERGTSFSDLWRSHHSTHFHCDSSYHLTARGNQNRFSLSRSEPFPLDNHSPPKHSATVTYCVPYLECTTNKKFTVTKQHPAESNLHFSPLSCLQMSMSAAGEMEDVTTSATILWAVTTAPVAKATHCQDVSCVMVSRRPRMHVF